MDALPEDRLVCHVWSAMCYAAQRGRESALRMLLRSVPANDGENRILVKYTVAAAAESGHTGIVRMLMSLPQGTCRTERSHYGAEMSAALSAAAERGHVDIVRELLDAPKHAPSAAHNGAALGRAAAKGHEAVVRLLLERGYRSAGLARRSDRARGQVMQAAQSAKLHGHESVVRLLEGWFAALT